MSPAAPVQQLLRLQTETNPGQLPLPANPFDSLWRQIFPLFTDSTRDARTLTAWLLLLTAVIAAITFLIMRLRRSRRPGLRRSPWSAKDRTNRPTAATLIATGTFRQRRRRRRRRNNAVTE